jgi:DNA-binding NtrC family response regulator
VEVAENGRIAIDMFRLTPDRYRAVVLDFAMPEADGEQAFLEIRQIRPKAVVLVMSGYSPLQVLARFEDKGLNGFIQKPFQSKDLIAALRQVLEADKVEG